MAYLAALWKSVIRILDLYQRIFMYLFILYNLIIWKTEPETEELADTEASYFVRILNIRESLNRLPIIRPNRRKG